MQTFYPLFRKFSTLIYFVSIMMSAHAQWTYVGSPGFSNDIGTYQSLVIGSDGAPYVAYNDEGYAPNGKAVVMKYTGTNWDTIGSSGFTANMAEHGCLAINSNDVLYFSFQDWANGGKVSVMTFDGSNWVYVGAPGFSVGNTTYTSLCTDANDSLYCAYIDAGSSGMAVVKKFDGVNWVAVGPTAEVSPGPANYTTLQISPFTATPWIVFSDGTASNNASVMAYNGANWLYVGAPGFTNSLSGVLQTDLAFDATGIPYVSYWDPFNSLKAGVRKFTGTAWDTVGPQGISPGQTYFTTLVMATDGVPYVTYMDYTVPNLRASTLKYNTATSDWTNVGPVGFSGVDAGYVTSAIDGNSTLYVSFVDGDNGNRTSVMKYQLCNPASTPIINPTSTSICPDDTAQFTLAGNLNDDTDWAWHIGDCNGPVAGTGTSFQIAVTDTTVIYVQGQGGCTFAADSCASVIINVNPAPAEPVVTVGAGGVLTSTAATTYEWFFGLNPIPGANSQVFNATSEGWYTVVVTNAFGCTAMSDSVEVSFAGTDPLNNEQVHIYPVPFDDYLQLTMDINVQDCQLSVVDQLGRVVFVSPVTQNNMLLDLHELAPGMYTVMLVHSQGKILRKVIKK